MRAAPIALALAGTLLPAGAAADSGFLLPPASAAALGRAGAVTADGGDPGSVWSNPAALAFDRPHAALSLGGSALRLRSRFLPASGAGDVASRPPLALAPALFGQLRVHPVLVLGVGVHVPAGFRTRWPDGWAGAQQSLRTSFFAAALTGVAAVRLTDRWSVGAGASLVRGGLQVLADLPAEAGGRADIQATDRAVGGHLAASFRLWPERLHLGATFHSRVRLKLSGPADFSPVNPAFADIFADQPVRIAIPLPDTLTLGLLYRPRPGLSLTADVARAGFGIFDRFHLDFDTPGTSDVVVERGQRNPLSLRAGVLAWLPRWPLALRGGLAFDDTATAERYQSPFAPDGRRLGGALGVGFLLDRWQLDVGYLYTHFLSAESRSPGTTAADPPAGRYRTGLHTLAVTVSVR